MTTKQMSVHREDPGHDGNADPKLPTSDLERLEELKNNMFGRFRAMFGTRDDGGKKYNYIPKVGDLVKIIELQRKLASDSKAEEKFWEMIDRLRQEELKDA